MMMISARALRMPKKRLAYTPSATRIKTNTDKPWAGLMCPVFMIPNDVRQEAIVSQTYHFPSELRGLMTPSRNRATKAKITAKMLMMV